MDSPTFKSEKLEDKFDDYGDGIGPEDEHDPEETSSSVAAADVNLDRDVEKNDLPDGAGHPQQSPPPVHNDSFLVKFEDKDPTDPRQFSNARKSGLTLLLGGLAFISSFGSSVITPAQDTIARQFNVSVESTVLTVSLYVLGFAVGPSIWAPISEVYGRKWSILPPVVVLGLFSIGTATSTTIASIYITRFFAGIFASAPISNVSAALGDLYIPEERGTAVAFYAVCVTGGPTIGPVVGSVLTVTRSLGWRWTAWIEAILAAFGVTLAYFTLPEVLANVILKRKAVRLRKETGDNRYWHPHEKEKITPSNIITKYFSRPLRMLLTEPMVICIAIYASFVYGLLYLTLEVFPIVFRDMRGYGPIVSTLPFLGLLIGVFAALGINIANQPFYARAVAKNKGRAVPEARLPPMLIGGFIFVAGLFLFGWTAAPKYSWALPTVAAGLIGAGFNVIFQQCINFLIDTYGPYAASAVAANTFLRSILACALPLAAKPMFHNLGVGPASSLLGGIATLALPVPLIFAKYGLRLRKMSKFAPVLED